MLVSDSQGCAVDGIVDGVGKNKGGLEHDQNNNWKKIEFLRWTKKMNQEEYL